MKNKTLTYLLALVVCLIWGLIIYRLLAGSSDSDDIPAKTETMAAKDPLDDYSVITDTSHLLLNYRDPFGLTVQKDTIKRSSKKSIQDKVKTPIEPVINWAFIKYSGYMRNPGSKKLITILSINGKSVSLIEGETAQAVKLIQNKVDSVKVSFNGKTRFIALNK
jgi:hypothetical protein